MAAIGLTAGGDNVSKPIHLDNISRNWGNFRRLAVHPTAADNQLRDMRRAFDAGAAMVLQLWVKANEKLTAAEREALIADLHTEMRASIADPEIRPILRQKV